jgi:diguanylate cyclase (GGDEF)-like protein
LLITLRARLTAAFLAAVLAPVLLGALIAWLAGSLTPAVAGLAALAALPGALLAWWLARVMTRPLAELAGAADRAAHGDLSARAPVHGPDEVGRVAGAFNRMTREMQGYLAALTASRDQLRGQLRVLGDTLSGTHDLLRIEEVVLATARSALGARSGAVLVASAEGSELVGIVDGATLRLPLGTGLLGTVACGSQARRGTFGPAGPKLAPGEPRGATYLAVPLRRPGSVRGVLALYDRLGSPEFDDADLTVLRTFADQAAIAVENVRAHEEARRLSHTDPLTGLYNYRMLKESMRREVERANRFGHQLAVLVLDLDRFKEVNDSHGHAAGDAVLAEFARRMRGEIREVDLAFRQGGEEFVLLLPETDAAGGATVGQRLCDAMRSTPMPLPPRRRLPAATGDPERRRLPAAAVGDPERLPASRRSAVNRRVPVTVSVGVAVFPEHGSSGAAVLQAADDALYAAKAAGRDTCRVAEARTGVVAGTAAGGASGSPHPPRQSRGR